MTVHELAAAPGNPAAADNIETLKALLPDYAKDIRLNLSNVIKEDAGTGLSLNQVQGVALAAAYATRNPVLVAAIAGEAKGLSPEEVNAAKAAATVMAMNNIYYRSTYMTGDDEIGRLPAGLRMTVIGNPGVDKITFELYSLGVSAINGCSACIAAHSKTVQDHGLSKTAVQHSFRIAAVVNAAAQALAIENA